MGPLRIDRVVLAAFAIPWLRREEFARVLAVPATLIAVLHLVWLSFAEQWPEWWSWSLWAIDVLLYTVFAVLCHRLVLLGSLDEPKPRWSMRETRFVTKSFSIWVVGVAGVMAASVVISPIALNAARTANGAAVAEAAKIALPYGSWLLFAYLCARLSLILPATAIDRRVRLRESWAWTRANGWRVALVISGLPWILHRLLNGIYRVDATSVESVLLTLGTLVVFTIQVALLSVCYRELSPPDDEPSMKMRA